jgi:lipoprotein-releasing system permease protein
MNRFLPFEWIAALRFLREGKMQTAFIIGGVAIGVAVIVFMSAMMQGLETNFIKRVLTSQPHIQLIAQDRLPQPLRNASTEREDMILQRPTQRVLSIDQWQQIRARVLAMPGIDTLSPSVSGSILAVRGDASRAVQMSGVEPDTYFRIVHLPDYMVAGQARLTSEDIIIGIELAKDLGVTLGDKINVSTAQGGARVLTVSGLFDMGNKAVNQRNTFVALRTAQSLLRMIGGVTSLDVTVNEIYSAEVLAQEIQAANLIQADSWIKTNAQFFTAVQAQRSSNTLIRVFVGLSVAFGIAAVLIVSVIQRSKDIGILRAMGTTGGQVLRIFLLQGSLLGFAGSLFGSAMGAGALIYWHSVARQSDGSELFPLILTNELFIYAGVLAALTGLIAAAAPAVRAAKLDPVVAIRG